MCEKVNEIFTNTIYSRNSNTNISFHAMAYSKAVKRIVKHNKQDIKEWKYDSTPAAKLSVN